MATRRQSKKTTAAKPTTSKSAALGIHLKQSAAVYTKSAMLEYGTYVVENRAIPSIHDGLKPVHRAILWAAYKLGLRHSGGYKKSARLTGDVIGKYHPHGDCLRGNTMIPIRDPILGFRFVSTRSIVDSGVASVPIWAFDESNNTYVETVAHSFRVGQRSRRWLKLEFDKGRSIEVTFNHPFLLTNGMWRKAEHLEVGSSIRSGYLMANRAPSFYATEPGSEMLGVVRSITPMYKIEEEDFYDFTVDTYENMCVCIHSSNSAVQPAFVVAHNSSVYGAMVGLAGTRRQGETTGWLTRNTTVPLLEGQGNWGDFMNGAAAMRYSECKLSVFAEEVLLDPDYLAVADYLPNYDGSEKLPLLLPAKLPVILLNGYEAIGVGAAAQCPAFELKGVMSLVERLLRGQKLTMKEVCSLKLDPRYGGGCLNTPKELLPIAKTGKGSLDFCPTYDFNQAKKTLVFTSVCPGMESSNTVQKFMERLAAVKGVTSVYDDSGKLGTRFVVEFSRSVNGKALDAALQACLDLSVRRESYSIGVSYRKAGESPKFGRVGVFKLLEQWVEWRVEFELKVIKRLLEIENARLAHQKLMLLAVDNLEIILQSLRVKKDVETVKIDGKPVEVDASAAFLMKKLKLTLDEANVILDMRVRQLRAMEKIKILAKIKEHEQEIVTLKKGQKAPNIRAADGLKSLSVKYF